jgi:hypothetical protein
VVAEDDRYATDLRQHDPDFTAQADVAIRAALGEHRFVAHHATRLLPHELESVRGRGLIATSDELARSKLEEAATALGPSVVTDDEIELVLRSGPMVWQGTRSSRQGEVCLAAPFDIFDRFGGFNRLLGDWGGELISWCDNAEAKAVVDRISAASTASIVDVAIGSGDVPDRHLSRLWSVAVGVLLDLESSWSEWRATGIGPQQVLAIRHPGQPGWPEAYSHLT